MNAEKGTLLGLGTILVAAAILVVGYWEIWDRERFWYHPLFQSHSSLSFEDARAIFNDYAQENANLNKDFAERRKLNFTKTVNASTTKDRQELFAIIAERSQGMPGVFLPTKETPLEEVRARAIGGLAAESHQLSNLEAAENSALVMKYR